MEDSPMGNSPTARPLIEGLENRQLLSTTPGATLGGRGTLKVQDVISKFSRRHATI